MNPVIDFIDTKLSQIDDELSVKASEYDQQLAPLRDQIDAFRVGFENNTASLNAQRNELLEARAKLTNEVG